MRGPLLPPGREHHAEAWRRIGWILTIITLSSLVPTTADAQGTDTLSYRLLPQVQLSDPAAAASPASHQSAAREADEPVRVDYCPRPTYPTALSEYGFPGTVVLQFVVDTLGRAELEDLVVTEASNAEFIASARRAIAKCRYGPARKGGRPVRFRVQQRVVWRQDAEPGP
jgi:outer membrane biosynthesis protein TonB